MLNIMFMILLPHIRFYIALFVSKEASSSMQAYKLAYVFSSGCMSCSISSPAGA